MSSVVSARAQHGSHFVAPEIRCPTLKNQSRLIQDCSPPQNQTQYRASTKCRATCNGTGYRLIGPRNRECLSTGKWTGYDQSCAVGLETTSLLPSSPSQSKTSATITPKYLGRRALLLLPFHRSLLNQITRTMPCASMRTTRVSSYRRSTSLDSRSPSGSTCTTIRTRTSFR